MITVTLGEAKPQEAKPFPKLMKHKTINGIVLFHCEKCGIVVSGSKIDFWDIGYYCKDWDMDSFADHNETITIQNA